MHHQGRTAPVSVCYYPDYRGTNPYQAILYEAMRPFAACRAAPISEALAAQRAAPDETIVFHLHWEHQVLIDKDHTVEAFLDDLAAFREAGGRVVWTVHNLIPHERYAEQDVADLIGALHLAADVIHFHSLNALQAACAARAVPLSKVRIIPHGNYAGHYRPVPRAEAREALGLGEAAMVALLPGRIGPYKAPGETVAAFLDAAGPEDRLIVAGHFVNGLTLETGDDPRILLRPGFATAEGLALYHGAADIVLLPYRRSLTSGSAILAATLGRGVLGSDTEGLRDAVLPGLTGTLFDADDPGALASALKQALREGPETWQRRGRIAATHAAVRDREIIGAAWKDVLTALMPRRPGG